MQPPLLFDAGTVARIDGDVDVLEQLRVGAGFFEEQRLIAGLEQFAALVVHLPDVDVGQAEGELQPLFGAFGLLQRLDQFGDVVGRDHQAADLAGGIAPGLYLGVEPGGAAIRALGAQPLDADRPACRQTSFELADPGRVDARREIEERPGKRLVGVQLQVRRPHFAVRDHPHVAVREHQRHRQAAHQLDQHGAGGVALDGRLGMGAFGLGALPFVGEEVGDIAEPFQLALVIGPGRVSGDAQDAGRSAVRQPDRSADIGLQEGRALHQGVVRVNRVLGGVLDPQGLAGRDDSLGDRIMQRHAVVGVSAAPELAVMHHDDNGVAIVEQAAGDPRRPLDHRHGQVDPERRRWRRTVCLSLILAHVWRPGGS